MGKIIEQIVDRFDGGITNDLRTSNASKYGITKHFDAFTYPHKLIPRYMTEAAEDKTYDIVKFLYARDSAGNSRLYGYGVAVGTTKAAVYYWNGTNAWTNTSGNEATNTGRNETVFFYYKDYIYMFRSNNLMRYHTTVGGWSSDVNTDAYKSITNGFTNLAQPVHHPSDDIAYFFTDNRVHTLNNATWTEDALQLPNDLKITCACPYGNYLAIGCASLKDTDKKSIVYLWDRDSSLTTLTDRIDFGSGELTHLATLNNKLIGIVNFYLNDSNGLRKGKIIVRQASGQFAVDLSELNADNESASALPATRVVQDNKLYFPATIPLASDDNNRMGIWAVDSNGRLSLDTLIGEATSYEGIIVLGNTWWVAHSNDGSVNRSDDNMSYQVSEPGIYESIIFNLGDSSKKKKLLGVTTMTEPLSSPIGITKITMKYRKDGDTSWTTIMNHSDNTVSHSAVNIESTGANLPEFREIQFRIESYGGAIPTGFKFKAEETDKNPY